ncbi:hypothetical protein [Actinokineospora pegani]|uniref:hypothetical protein n=1 Tax=Actinokineospora pegani TaxID=2654637 RepID=UPI001F275FB4|nr:hypothetical protein [Actinokineospora pegani]
MIGFPRTAVRRHRALATAAAIERLVDDRVAAVHGLPEESRGRHADHLAELVFLAEAYRAFGKGWLGKRELDRRAAAASRRLNALRVPMPTGAPLTDRD